MFEPDGFEQAGFEQDGFEIVRQFVDQQPINAIKQQVASAAITQPKHGIRNADRLFSTVEQLANSEPFMTKAAHLLGGQPQIVRVIFFDKMLGKNWLVSWHQDKTIALSHRIEIANWGPWSNKAGVVHVQPDLSVINQMVTLRLHLDDTDRHNGCLQLIPASHQQGILNQAAIDECIRQSTPQAIKYCEVQAGDLIAMKPHILHSSAKSLHPAHRRVVHIEYSSFALPNGLTWG